MFLMLSAALGADGDDDGALQSAEASGFEAVEPTVPPAYTDVVLQGATVMTANGAVIEDGHVVIAGGKITAVGEGPAPDGDAPVLDVHGHFVTPGLIDTHSHLGVYPAPHGRAHGDGNEATAPTTPGVWAEHSFFPQDPGLQLALEGGITALQILPGSANLIGGRGVVLQNVPHRGSRAMRFPGAPETVKMACGENPKRVYGDRGGPSTRMGNLRGHRMAFHKAVAYKRKWDEYGDKLGKGDAEDTSKKKKKKQGEDSKKDDPKPPERDLDKDTLVGVLEGRILLQVHCYRADDMLSFMQVASEFDFSVRSFHHALDAYKIRDVLADRNVASSTWADWWGFKLEAFDGIPHNAALLTEAGARAIIHSDSGEGIQRLNQEAGKAYWTGKHAGIELSEDAALRWITVNPAWALGIDDQTGTLEVGKRADVVVWNGHPFSVYAKPRYVFVEGVLRHDVDRHSEPWSDFQVGQEVQP